MVSVDMKYSVVVLLALFGLSAASILQQQEDVLNHRNNNNGLNLNINNNNNNNNGLNLNRNNKNNNNNGLNLNNNGLNLNNNGLDLNNNNDDLDTITNTNYNGNNNNNNNNGQIANQQFLQKQKIVLELLSNLQKNNPNQHLVQQGNNFNPFLNINKFNNQQAVKKFLKNYNNNNFLPLNEVFTPTSQQHQNQAAQLFTFLYSAQDFTTLKLAAAWARTRFNTDLYAYAFSATVLNHPTTQGVVIPALYEVIPHAFVPATALHKIYNAKIQGVQRATVHANYNNQNQNNNNYNNNNQNTNENNNNENNNNNNGNNNGSHNPNYVFAENDGSQNNNAGTAENPENRVSYFTEDVTINDIHARFHIQNPAFLGSNNNNNYFTSNLDNTNNNDNNNNENNNNNIQDIKRGEDFYFAHQQLYARYVLERLSNNLPIPHPINLNGEIKIGYNPNLQYANGQAVPARPPKTQFQQQQVEDTTNNNNAQQPNNNQAQNPQVYEQRLQQAAESGYVLNQDGSKTQLNNKNGLSVLANLLAAPASSVNPAYYGDYFSTAKNAIGNIVDPNNQNNVAPGAVTNYATAARDPAYYQLLAKVNQIFNNLQNKQGPYAQSQVAFPGVKIQNLDVSNLVTYFETVSVNVNNAIPTNNGNNNNGNNNNGNNNNNNNNNNDDVNDNNNNGNNDNNDNGNYIVKFQRLTNKPFNYQLRVLSDKNTNAVVRIFIGPKYDSNGQKFTLPQASQYFVQLDKFLVQLNNGQNVIQRNSQQSQRLVKDPLTFQQLWNRVQEAEQGQQPFFINKAQRHQFGLPVKAQLPKGKRSGQQFVLYAIINDANNNNDNTNLNVDINANYNNNNNNQNGNNYENDNTNNNYDNVNTNTNNNNNNNYLVQDNRSIGFPLDRPVVDSTYNTANQYFKTVTVYHHVQNEN